jgi:alpha-ribazole phosphatase
LVRARSTAEAERGSARGGARAGASRLFACFVTAACERSVPMLTVHLVRHGETMHAAQLFFAGDIDPPLTEQGHAEAEAVARVAGSLGLQAMYVSPKLRARTTAEPIARACGVQPIVDEGLREIAYGTWEGRKESEVEASEPEAYGAWSQDPALYPPPGGESAFAVAARAVPVLVRACRELPNGHVMMVSHKATIRILVCALLGVPLGRFRERLACPTASITTIEFDGRRVMLLRLGDVHHLERPGPCR